MNRRTLLMLGIGVAGLAAGLTAYLAVYRPGVPVAGPGAVPVPAPQTDRLALRAHKAPIAVPEFGFEDGSGARRSLAEFRGRYVLLNVWATWCPPCREEMPSLERLQVQLGGTEFQVLALSVDSGRAQAVRDFYAELGLKALEVYVDRKLQVNSALRIVGLPATVLLDPEGREIARHIGPAQWDSPGMVQSIRLLTAAAGR